MSESESKTITITGVEHVKRYKDGTQYIEVRAVPVLDRPVSLKVGKSVSPTRQKIREEARAIALASRTIKEFCDGLRDRKIPLTRHYQGKHFSTWDKVGNDLKEQAGLRSLKRRAKNGEFPLA